MEIEVYGKANKLVKPDTFTVNLIFNEIGKDYNKVLDQGLNAVENTIHQLSLKGYSANDFKTQQFYINKNNRYDETTKTYQPVYNFYQSVALSFPYNKEKLNEVTQALSEIKQVSYNIEASLKEMEKYNQELYEKAFLDAKKKAEIIAKIACKKLEDCEEIEEINQMIGGPIVLRSETNFQTTYNPSDIILEKQLKVEWRTK